MARLAREECAECPRIFDGKGRFLGGFFSNLLKKKKGADPKLIGRS